MNSENWKSTLGDYGKLLTFIWSYWILQNFFQIELLGLDQKRDQLLRSGHRNIWKSTQKKQKKRLTVVLFEIMMLDLPFIINIIKTTPGDCRYELCNNSCLQLSSTFLGIPENPTLSSLQSQFLPSFDPGILRQDFECRILTSKRPMWSSAVDQLNIWSWSFHQSL